MGKYFSNSGDFTMGDGNRSILWNSRTRQLEGDRELIEQIREELNGKQQTIMDVGTIWMDEREPVAHHGTKMRLVVDEALCFGYFCSPKPFYL